MQLNLAISILLCVLLAVWQGYGSRWAIAVAWGAAILSPTWIYKYEGPIRLDLQILVAAFAVGVAYVTGKGIRRFVWADLFVVGLATTQVISEYLGEHFKWTEVTVAAADWILPYVFGRIALQSMEDMNHMIGVSTWCSAILSGWAAVESILHFDPIKTALSHASSMQSQFDVRWGFRRAEGPMEHPIFFGLVLVLLLPWTIAAAERAKAGLGPKWWKAAPWINAAGIFLAMSRGPQLAALLVVAMVAFFRLPHLRKRLVTIGVGGALLVVTQYGLIMAVLHSWSAEDRHESSQISIRGENYEYSGTSHRLLQMIVFEDAFFDAGWFGFGSERMIDKDIPDIEPHLLVAFSSIDNHYLLHGLKNGLCGLICYLLLSAACLIRLAPAALAIRSPFSIVAAGLFGSITALLIMLATVFLADDFGFQLTFAMGAACSLRTCSDENKTLHGDADNTTRPSVATTRRRRLTVGHPVSVALLQIKRIAPGLLYS